MKKIFLFFLIVLFIVILAIPSFASGVELSYNGQILPALPSPYQADYTNFCLSFSNGSYWLYQTIGTVTVTGDKAVTTVNGYAAYRLSDGVWKYSSASSNVSLSMSGASDIFWTSADILTSGGSIFLASSLPTEPPCTGEDCPASDLDRDNICDDCGRRFLVEREYPFSVSDFLSHVGQIFTSAVSWVSDVGAAIISQPLLLAFTALPLCGLGIAVFRRLKNTV